MYYISVSIVELVEHKNSSFYLMRDKLGDHLSKSNILNLTGIQNVCSACQKSKKQSFEWDKEFTGKRTQRESGCFRPQNFKTTLHKNEVKRQTPVTTKLQTGKRTKWLSIDRDDHQILHISLNNHKMTSSDLKIEQQMAVGVICKARTVLQRLLWAACESCKARKKALHQ